MSVSQIERTEESERPRRQFKVYRGDGQPRRRMPKAIRELWLALVNLAIANRLTLKVLWLAQPRATLVRLLLGVLLAVGPLAAGWGLSEIIRSVQSGTVTVTPLVVGVLVHIAGLNVLIVAPVIMGSLERMGDNCTFESVFTVFTRKMITFIQEHLADTTLSDRVKQVKERAVWRMMSMARIQPTMIRTLVTLVIASVIVLGYAPVLLVVLVLFAIPSMRLELEHARQRALLDERLGPIWGGLWSDLYNLMVAPALSMLHMFGAATWFADRYEAGLAKASKEECDLERSAACKRIVAALVSGLGLTISFAWLVYWTASEEMTAGDLIFVSGAATGIATCLAEGASLLGQQWSQTKTLQDMLEFLENPASEPVSPYRVMRSNEVAVSTPLAAPCTDGPLRGASLCFDDVWYQYPASEDAGSDDAECTEDGNDNEKSGIEKYAVRGISFSIEPGSVVAVVGPNGAGKSTTLGLLLRQLTPSRGRILINGRSITEMSLEEFAREVVMMPQQFRHFNLTLRELLNLARPLDPANDNELWRELERIDAARMVRKWKHGLDTQLGVERRQAVEPSGGQLQRLFLASVFLAGKGLSVFDEPVAAVDPDAAKLFWDGVFDEASRQKRTVIFTTHHLGAVRRAHSILYIADGRVAAQGTHDELMRSSEQYKRLFDAQADDYR